MDSYPIFYGGVDVVFQSSLHNGLARGERKNQKTRMTKTLWGRN